ncbi:Uma2 family endonuclease [Chamaesiphon sp. VAR_48_metabat_403]|uniref:Uma2 family endonuclease n=1 Tax=Chamaesiphon sp. VAR_48_metabat_403 TaxID=2964700 RepID=UPI00286EAD52|nr:Uma2 family endonuclease [Chamaesiphon sp. VAR_48_metabat_403]
MIQTVSQKKTLAEFLAMPETKPANEFVDGSIYQKPLPQGKHSIIQRELTFAIDRPLKDRKIARAFPELRCTFGDRSIVPDISIILWDRIPRNPDSTVANIFPIASDWTIEILSPEQGQTKVVKNIMHCLKYGTQMGWLIDPDEQTVFVYQPKQEVEIFDNASQQLLMPKLAARLQISVGQIFDWLLE